MVRTARLRVRTRGGDDVVDVTEEVGEALGQSGLSRGIACVFVVGSTAGLTTIEYEPGLIADMGRAMERFAPKDAHYEHEARWGDDNGHSHVRAAAIGPSATVPFEGGRLLLGRWQQIVLLEFDTRPREREIIVQIVGE